MSTAETEFQSKLAALKQQFQSNAALAVATMQSLWDSVLQDPENAAALDRLERLCHKLAGSSGTYGFDAIGEAAGKLEAIVGEIRLAKSDAPLKVAKEGYGALQRLQSLLSTEFEAPAIAASTPTVEMHDPRQASQPANDPVPVPEIDDVAPTESDEWTYVPKILVADDDPFVTRALKLQLSRYAVDVLEAASGRQAYDIAFRERPDCIVTDYSMPDGTAEYLMNRLQQSAELRDIPVLVITASKVGGKTNFALRRDFLGRMKVAEYIEKPLKPGRLIKSLRQHVTLRLKAAAQTASTG